MSREELTKRISDKLKKQIAFGGLTRRKTVAGEIILECPIVDTRGEGSLEPLAVDLTQIFLDYITEMSLRQFKALVKDMFL